MRMNLPFCFIWALGQLNGGCPYWVRVDLPYLVHLIHSFKCQSLLKAHSDILRNNALPVIWEFLSSAKLTPKINFNNTFMNY